MKFINVIVLVMLVYSCICELEFTTKTCTQYSPKKYGGDGSQAFSLDFCRATKWEDDTVACCFVKWENSEGKRQYNCAPVTSYGLANIDEAIEIFKSSNSASDVDSFDCSASYLYGPLLLILAFFL